jgi:hypothetical protein
MRSAKSGNEPHQPSSAAGDAADREQRLAARAMQRARDEAIASEHDRIAAGLAGAEFGETELARARRHVGEWVQNGTCSSWYANRWSEILSGPPAAVASRMRALAGDERRALFQNTPFGFLLSERVRD